MFKLAWNVQKTTDGIITHDPCMGFLGAMLCAEEKVGQQIHFSTFYKKKKESMNFEYALLWTPKPKVLKSLPDGGPRT